MHKFLIGALALSLLLAAILGRVAMTEHANAKAARDERDALIASAAANEAGIAEMESGAQEREIRYVEIVREVAAAGPVSEECREDPALRAAGAGVLSLRAAYCDAHPDRCASHGLPSAGDGAP